MTVYPLEQADRAFDDLADGLTEQLRAKVGRAVHHLYARTVLDSPRLEGELAASWWPFLGMPSPSWVEGDTSPAGDAAVQAIVEAWQPGDRIGIATDAPYARKLVFHTARYTKQARPGWLDLILSEARAILVTS